MFTGPRCHSAKEVISGEAKADGRRKQFESRPSPLLIFPSHNFQWLSIGDWPQLHSVDAQYWEGFPAVMGWTKYLAGKWLIKGVCLRQITMVKARESETSGNLITGIRHRAIEIRCFQHACRTDYR
jgi:hypothetical protein